MQEKTYALLLSDIRVPFDAPDEEALKIAQKKLKSARLDARLRFHIYKKSLDARRKQAILKVCSVLAECEEPIKFSPAALERIGARPFSRALPEVRLGDGELGARPLVVGMGPAGLFAALMLAEQGYAPVIIDRGDDVFTRARAVERFSVAGVLDTESNIQFGAGGAGTFSDGKLVTRVNDPLCNYVLSRLVEFGAPAEILQKQKPHVGTDILREVVQGILSRIEELGGTVKYRTKLEDLSVTEQGVRVRTCAGEIEAGAVLLAIGHSARDTFELLLQKGLLIEPKPFSVGVRIEHLREDIDRALYGDLAGHPALGVGEYALADTTGTRGVYTFCMCPGGEVVAAASEEGGVVVNGMSHHARDGRNANCAVAVSVRVSDYEPVDGNVALGAIAYQRRIEQAAFALGGGNYSAPIQTVGDFLDGTLKREPSRITPTYRNGAFVRVADISQAFPSYVTDALRYGLTSFDRKLAGFACADAVLSAAETRTSAPVRVLRGEDGQAVGHPCVYPCGEGAGYAGGITSAAVDGLKTALRLMARFAPPN